MGNGGTNDKLQASIARMVTPKAKPKDILKRLQKRHPDVKTREIALAAFAAMIDVADADPEKAWLLQDFALKERD